MIEANTGEARNGFFFSSFWSNKEQGLFHVSNQRSTQGATSINPNEDGLRDMAKNKVVLMSYIQN